MVIHSAAVPPRRQPDPAPLVAGNLCPAGPIPFTRDVALADWIHVQIGKGEREERLSVTAQVVFLGLSPDGEIGFVARAKDGTIFRGWEDAVMLASGPCWAAMIITEGRLALPIALHGAVFPLPIKARPIKSYTRMTETDAAPSAR